MNTSLISHKQIHSYVYCIRRKIWHILMCYHTFYASQVPTSSSHWAFFCCLNLWLHKLCTILPKCFLSFLRYHPKYWFYIPRIHFINIYIYIYIYFRQRNYIIKAWVKANATCFDLKSHPQDKVRTMKFFTVWLRAFGIPDGLQFLQNL